MINQTMARRYFPGINPIGKHIAVDRNSKPGWFGSDQPYEIVGLVGDVKAIELRDPPACLVQRWLESDSTDCGLYGGAPDERGRHSDGARRDCN